MRAGSVPLRAIRPLFDEALARYAEAEAIRPAGNDDPILRWNSCVRALEAAEQRAADEQEPSVDWALDTVPHER